MRYDKILILALSLFAFLMPALPSLAEAAATDAGYPSTTVTTINTTAVQIWPSGPTDCMLLMLCADPDNNGAVFIRQSSTAISGTIGGVNASGFALYPSPSTGDTCRPIPGREKTQYGSLKTINSQYFYAAMTAASAGKIRAECDRRAANP